MCITPACASLYSCPSLRATYTNRTFRFLFSSNESFDGRAQGDVRHDADPRDQPMQRSVRPSHGASHSSSETRVTFEREFRLVGFERSHAFRRFGHDTWHFAALRTEVTRALHDGFVRSRPSDASARRRCMQRKAPRIACRLDGTGTRTSLHQQRHECEQRDTRNPSSRRGRRAWPEQIVQARQDSTHCECFHSNLETECFAPARCGA